MKLKIFHVLFILLLFTVITTGIAGYFIFSKEHIMNGVNQALSIINGDPFTNIVIYAKDNLFISKIVRRFDWSIHFFSGVLLFVILTIFIWNKKKTFFIKTVYILYTLTFVTGMILYFRFFKYLSSDMFVFLKISHKTFASLFVIVIFYHILEKIKPKEIK